MLTNRCDINLLLPNSRQVKQKESSVKYRRRCGFDETLLLGRPSSSSPKQSLEGAPGETRHPVVHWPVLVTSSNKWFVNVTANLGLLLSSDPSCFPFS